MHASTESERRLYAPNTTARRDRQARRSDCRRLRLRRGQGRPEKPETNAGWRPYGNDSRGPEPPADIIYGFKRSPVICSCFEAEFRYDRIEPRGSSCLFEQVSYVRNFMSSPTGIRGDLTRKFCLTSKTKLGHRHRPVYVWIINLSVGADYYYPFNVQIEIMAPEISLLFLKPVNTESDAYERFFCLFF